MSHDGTRVACSRSREGSFAHRHDLWLYDIDGHGHRQLSQGRPR